jgi:hypothetical protein
VGRYLSALVAPQDQKTVASALAEPDSGLLRYAVRTANGDCLEVESRGRTMGWRGRPVRLVVVSFLGEAKGCGEEGE